MKKFLFSVMVMMAVAVAPAMAQDDMYVGNGDAASQRVAARADSVARVNNIFAAGRLLKRSATFDYAAIGMAGLGGIVAGIGAGQDKIDDARPFYWSAVGCGVAAVVFRIVAINYKSKAGQRLELTPGGVRVTF